MWKTSDRDKPTQGAFPGQGQSLSREAPLPEMATGPQIWIPSIAGQPGDRADHWFARYSNICQQVLYNIKVKEQFSKRVKCNQNLNHLGMSL